ncbi:MAG: redoxin domain-containing protein [Myxococcota bacterium]|nr:redoxin domain-containing protein [Myxococcota bacterium]
MKWFSYSVVSLGVLFFVACGGTASTNTCSVVDSDATRAAYPTGAYGTEECGVIANLEFKDTENKSHKLDQYFSDKAAKYLLFVTAADWCTVCKAEQGQLQSIHEAYQPKGLRTLISIFETQDRDPATSASAKKWKEAFELTFDVVADEKDLGGEYYDSSAPPMSMVINLDTMQIERIILGANIGAVEAAIEARLP